MSSLFVALLSNPPNDDPVAEQQRWHAPGLRCCFVHGGVRVLVSQGTPFLALSERALLIGRIFTRLGTPVEHLRCDRSGVALHEHLLQDYWGEYVLVEALDSGGTRFLRDPSGGMQCVYSVGGAPTFVTSSISLAAELGLYGREVDWDFIRHALVYPYVRSQRTGLLGIKEVLPGCSLEITGHTAKAATEWSPWTFASEERRVVDISEAAAGVRDAVQLAVRAWAEMDRRVLLELSGGLDSSIVAACLQQTSAHTTCCTLVGPLPETDERQYARQVADPLGFELLAADIDIARARFDFQPPVDAVAPAMGILHYPVDAAVTSVAEQLEITSLFSGAGGDSIFCYLRGATPAADAFRAQGLSAAVRAIRDLSMLHGCPTSQAARLTLSKLRRGPKPAYRPNLALLDQAASDVALDVHPWLEAPDHALAGDCERIAELSGTHSYRDGLARSGRWPMRYPLLSQPVMEACLRVPTWMWIAGGRDRSIARQAFADALPPAIQHRRSKGSFARYYAYVFERNREGMHRFLLDGMLAAHGLLDRDALMREAATDRQLTGPPGTRLFELCMVENWVRHQGDTSGVPGSAA